MTFDALCKLPNGTPVRLLDDRVGRMAVWHKVQKAVGVQVPGKDYCSRSRATRSTFCPIGPWCRSRRSVTSRRASLHESCAA